MGAGVEFDKETLPLVVEALADAERGAERAAEEESERDVAGAGEGEGDELVFAFVASTTKLEGVSLLIRHLNSIRTPYRFVESRAVSFPKMGSIPAADGSA